MRTRERNSKRKKKNNLIIFWFKRSKKNLLKNNKNSETGNRKRDKDFNKLWSKTNRIKEELDKKQKDKELRYIYVYSGH